MDERESLRVKGKTTDRVGLRVVLAVSGNRMSDPLRVYADLILSSSLKLEFYLCVILSINLTVFECAAVRGCVMPVFLGRVIWIVSFSESVAVHLHGLWMFVKP